jgi:hypothetical protein
VCRYLLHSPRHCLHHRVAGTPSYECPFQTLASITLRHLRDSGTTRKFSVSLSPLNITSLICPTGRISWQGLVSTSHRIHGITRHPFPWEISLSRVVPGINNETKNTGHQTTILLPGSTEPSGTQSGDLPKVFEDFGAESFSRASSRTRANSHLCHGTSHAPESVYGT